MNVINEKTNKAKSNLDFRLQRRVSDDIPVFFLNVDALPDRTRQGGGSEATVRSLHTFQILSTIENMTSKRGKVEKVPLDGRRRVSAIQVK